MSCLCMYCNMNIAHSNNRLSSFPELPFRGVRRSNVTRLGESYNIQLTVAHLYYITAFSFLPHSLQSLVGGLGGSDMITD
jgi:hypothetical protein